MSLAFSNLTYPKKIGIILAAEKEGNKQLWQKNLRSHFDEPTLGEFSGLLLGFLTESWFATEKIRQLVESAKKAGAVGAAQNMIGEAVHAVVHEKNANSVAEAFKQTLPQQQVIVSKIDFQGARLIK